MLSSHDVPVLGIRVGRDGVWIGLLVCTVNV